METSNNKSEKCKWRKIKKLFNNFTGHDIRDISSFDDFTNFMWTEVDAASLGICRMLFGKEENKKPHHNHNTLAIVDAL